MNLEKYDEQAFIQEYFYDNGMPEWSVGEEMELMDRRSKYKKAKMVLANVNNQEEARHFFNEYDKLKEFNNKLANTDVKGIYAICNENIFEAVYSTNLLMPNCDLLITKPSELAYYPIPKLFMKHIGGHEVYGAINGREKGDSTFECPTKKEINQMLDRLLSDKEILIHMVDQINVLNKNGAYNGAYECVRLAVGEKHD